MKLTSKKLHECDSWFDESGVMIWSRYTLNDGAVVLECTAPPHLEVEELPDTDFDILTFDFEAHLLSLTRRSTNSYGFFQRRIAVTKVSRDKFLCLTGCFCGSFTEFAQAVKKRYRSDRVVGASYIYGMASLIEALQTGEKPREQYYMEKLAKWK